MTTQQIQSHDISITTLFQSFYAVPDYQREYIWGEDQVEQLLTDILGELSDTEPDQAPEYFIGSIVVCPGRGGSGVFDLIDGQQRMTTLYITLCAIRDRLKVLDDDGLSVIRSQIAAASVNTSGEETRRYRLDLQYEDSGNALISVATGEPISNGTTRSVQNIANAYHVATKFLTAEFGDDSRAVRKFYGYLTNKVKLIRIETEDVAKALKIFETINDRGVGLNSMDLLKNLLFMKATEEQFDRLKDTWKELQDTIFNMREKPLRFLRYFIFSRYDVDVLREDEIYGWFSRNEEIAGYGSNPIGFAGELVSAAGAYRNFRAGKDESGNPNRYLDNMRILGGRAARQHLILLLAGRHLSSQLFDRLAQEVENLFFCYVITREPTREFERSFSRWATELRGITTTEQFDEFIARRFAKEKANLSARFDDALSRLAAYSLQKYRFRYVLSKLTQYVDLKAYGETESTRWLSTYTSGGYEIEHIFPLNPCAEAAEEFGIISDPEIIDKLGNLVLVEGGINSSLQNRAYSQKRAVYRESRLLLTRALAERPRVGENTQIDRAVSAIEPFPEWTEASVDERQQSLLTLARAVWGIPDAGLVS